MVQWVGLFVFTAVVQVQSLVGELRSRKLGCMAKKKKRKNWHVQEPRKSATHMLNLSYLEIVFVHSGCCNKISQTCWFITTRNLFLTVLEAGSLRLGCQHGWVRPLPGLRLVPGCSHGRGSWLCRISFVTAVISS